MASNKNKGYNMRKKKRMFYEASRMQHCLAWMFLQKKKIIHLHFDESFAL